MTTLDPPFWLRKMIRELSWTRRVDAGFREQHLLRFQIDHRLCVRDPRRRRRHSLLRRCTRGTVRWGKCASTRTRLRQVGAVRFGELRRRRPPSARDVPERRSERDHHQHGDPPRPTHSVHEGLLGHEDKTAQLSPRLFQKAKGNRVAVHPSDKPLFTHISRKLRTVRNIRAWRFSFVHFSVPWLRSCLS